MQVNDSNSWLDKNQRIALDREALCISSPPDAVRGDPPGNELDAPLFEQAEKTIFTAGGDDSPLTIITAEDLSQRVSDTPELRKTRGYTFEQDADGNHATLKIAISHGGTLPPAVRGALSVADEHSPATPFIEDSFEFIGKEPIAYDKIFMNQLGWQLGETLIESGWAAVQQLISKTHADADLGISKISVTSWSKSEKQQRGAILSHRSVGKAIESSIRVDQIPNNEKQRRIDAALEFGSTLESLALELTHLESDPQFSDATADYDLSFSISTLNSTSTVSRGDYVDVIFHFKPPLGDALDIQFSINIEPEYFGSSEPFLADITLSTAEGGWFAPRYCCEFSPTRFPLSKIDKALPFFEDLFQSVAEHCDTLFRTPLRDSKMLNEALHDQNVKPGNMSTFLRELYFRFRGR
jgi:hypothetical protein